MRLIDNPCLKCKERQVGCHGSCEKYIQSKKKTEVAKENERAYKEHIDYLGERKRKRERKR